MEEPIEQIGERQKAFWNRRPSGLTFRTRAEAKGRLVLQPPGKEKNAWTA